MYADQDLLQFDYLRLQLDPGSVISTGERFPELEICAIVCGFHFRRGVTYNLIFTVAFMLLSSVETPPDVAAKRLDNIRVRVSTTVNSVMRTIPRLIAFAVVVRIRLVLEFEIQILSCAKRVCQYADK